MLLGIGAWLDTDRFHLREADFDVCEASSNVIYIPLVSSKNIIQFPSFDLLPSTTAPWHHAQVTALEPILRQALRRLAPRGLLAFSVEQPQQCESFRLEVPMGSCSLCHQAVS